MRHIRNVTILASAIGFLWVLVAGGLTTISAREEAPSETDNLVAHQHEEHEGSAHKDEGSMTEEEGSAAKQDGSAAKHEGSATKHEGSDHKGMKGDMSEEDMQKMMMEKWEKYASPGPQHEMLAKMEGKWKATTEWRMGPGQEPTKTEGHATAEMMLDGRYLKEKFEGSFMDQSFTGMGITGYDNYKKKYVSLWMDSMSTAVFQMMGTCSEDGKMCTYHGRMDEFLMDEPDKIIKATLEWTDENTRVFKMYDFLPGGEEWVAMKIKYERVEE